MKFLNIIVLLFLLNLGCASVVRLPSSTGQTPMVGGRLWGGRAGLDLSSSVPVTIINDMTANPPVRNSIDIGSDPNLIADIFGINFIAGTGLDLTLGIYETVDIYFTRNVGLRWMWMGDPKGLGWRSTFFAGPTYWSESNSISSSTSPESKSETKVNGIEFGLSVGNQIDEKTLIYLTLASRGGKASTTVTNSSGAFSFDDSYLHYISSLGFVIGNEGFLKFELSGDYIEWKGNTYSGGSVSNNGIKMGGTLGAGLRW